MCGIYRITNQVNNKIYIGQSIYIEKRFINHKSTIYNIESESYEYPLYRAIRKYGLENFSFEVIEQCEIDELNQKEIFWIKYYDSYCNGYNQNLGGNAAVYNVKISDKDLLIILDLLQNSTTTQRQIAKDFNVGEDTISGINNGTTRVLQGYHYPIRIWAKEHICQDCGKKISRDSIRCIACAQRIRRVSERPNREELKLLIRTTPFTKIGEKYNVSDSAIRKWCKSYKLPSSSREIKSMPDTQWQNM